MHSLSSTHRDPGTEAAELVDQYIPQDVAAERMERLRQVIERSSLHSNQTRVGCDEEVIVEGRSKRDSGMLTGRTRHNRLVHFPPRTSFDREAMPKFL